jgi:hypothetical protein
MGENSLLFIVQHVIMIVLSHSQILSMQNDNSLRTESDTLQNIAMLCHESAGVRVI